MFRFRLNGHSLEFVKGSGDSVHHVAATYDGITITLYVDGNRA